MLKGLVMPGRMLLEAAAANYVWTENLAQVIIAALLSMVPTFEGRYAITVMLGMSMPAGVAYLLAVVFSTLPSTAACHRASGMSLKSTRIRFSTP